MTVAFLFIIYFVWQTLGLSTSLQMTQFCSFYGWVIFHFIYVSHRLYPFRYWWTFRSLPCPGYCKLCCNEHQGTCVFLNYGFSQGICPGVGLLGHMIVFSFLRSCHVILHSGCIHLHSLHTVDSTSIHALSSLAYTCKCTWNLCFVCCRFMSLYCSAIQELSNRLYQYFKELSQVTLCISGERV